MILNEDWALHHIFLHITVLDYCNVLRVCKKFRKILKSGIFQKEWPEASFLSDIKANYYTLSFLAGKYNKHYFLVYLLKSRKLAMDPVLFGACFGGHFSIVKYLSRSRDCNWDGMMFEAAQGGHLEIVKFCIDHGAENTVVLTYRAAKGGHLDIVKYGIDLGAEKDYYKITISVAGDSLYNNIMYRAAKGGHLSVIEFCIDHGACDWKRAIKGSIRGNHKHLLDYFIDLKQQNSPGSNLDDELYYALSKACRFGKLDLIDHLINRTTDQSDDRWKDALRISAKRNQSIIIDHLIERKFISRNEAMIQATDNCHLDLVRHHVSKGANNFNEGLIAAVQAYSIELVQFFVIRGANNIKEALDHAVTFGNKEAQKYLKDFQTWSKILRKWPK